MRAFEVMNGGNSFMYSCDHSTRGAFFFPLRRHFHCSLFTNKSLLITWNRMVPFTKPLTAFPVPRHNGVAPVPETRRVALPAPWEEMVGTGGHGAPLFCRLRLPGGGRGWTWGGGSISNATCQSANTPLMYVNKSGLDISFLKNVGAGRQLFGGTWGKTCE